MGSIGYVLLSEGFADWEPACAMVDINTHEDFKVITVGFSKSAVKSMGGLTVIPDIELSEVDINSAATFIIPGSSFWARNDTPEPLSKLLVKLHERKVPIGFICAATLIPARLGMYKSTRHTSNSLKYLKSNFPGYGDQDYYVDEMAAGDNGIITAGGLGYVEFTLEILKAVGIIKTEEAAREWYDAVKNGIVPASWGG